MTKICVNGDVFDKYRAGSTLNDAILEVHNDLIAERCEKNPNFAKLSPLAMVMADANISKNSQVEDMLSVQNSAYMSGGTDVNTWLFPAWVETTLRESMYGTDLLPYICTTRIGVDSNVVQTAMLNLLNESNKKALQKSRVAELADIPTGKITIGEKAITLWKRGRALTFSYEAARRMKIDIMAKHLQSIAADLAQQNVEAAIDVIANGDGNSGSTPISLGKTAGAKTVSKKDVVTGLYEYYKANKYAADVIIVPEKYMFDVAEFAFDKNVVPGISAQIGLNIPQIAVQNATVIFSADAKVNSTEAILFLNRDRTLIRYEENGSSIQEMDNFIRNQSKLMTTTENSAFALSMAGSNMYMEIKQS